MGKSSYVEKQNKMCVRVREKNKEGKIISRRIPCSNFTFAPIAQVGGEKDGYLIQVMTYPERSGNTLVAFCPSNPKRDTFVYFLNRELHDKGGGGLTCSLPDAMFKSQFVKKVLSFQNSHEFSYCMATKSLGKVLNDSVWVLSEKVQLDDMGRRIQDSTYIYVPDDRDLKLKIAEELTSAPLANAFKLLKDTLKHNFPAALFTIGALGMVCHAESIEEKFDGCPAIILVGEPGRGKSTALKLALSSIGMLRSGLIKTFSKEKILHRASSTTMGVFIDDPPSATACKELVVDFFNKATTGTIARGMESIRSGLMMTSNDVISGSSRELRRIVYIPFLGESVSGSTSAEIKSYVQLKSTINSVELSGAIATIILCGTEFLNTGWEEIIDNNIDDIRLLIGGSALPDVVLPYATLMWFTKKICEKVTGDKKLNRTIYAYFEDVMKDFIIKHQPAGSSEMESSLYVNDMEIGLSDRLKTMLDKIVDAVSALTLEEAPKYVRNASKDGRRCILLRADFLKHVLPTGHSSLISLISKADIGYSQSRRLNGRKEKPERCVLIVNEAFSQEQQQQISNDNRLDGQNIAEEMLEEERREIGPLDDVEQDIQIEMLQEEREEIPPYDETEILADRAMRRKWRKRPRKEKKRLIKKSRNSH